MPSGNMDLLDTYAAVIFGMLYESFPEPRPLDVLQISCRSYAEEKGRVKKLTQICRHTVIWLADAGFLRFESATHDGFQGVVLTAKGAGSTAGDGRSGQQAGWMMYSEPKDLSLLLAEKELVQLAADGRPGRWDDEQTQAVLAEAINQADGEIDGYISLRVNLPLTFPPKIIRVLSAKIAVYNLLRRRVSVPDHWRGEYDRCLALLKDIAAGKLALPDEGDGGADDGDADPGSIAVVTRPPWDGLG